jgi:hypothetical protein
VTAVGGEGRKEEVEVAIQNMSYERRRAYLKVRNMKNICIYIINI